MGVERVPGAAGLRGGRLTRVLVDGVPVCVVRTRDGRWYAVRDRCSHLAVPLSEGVLRGDRVECPLHASRFDLATGAPAAPPATAPVRTYHVVPDGDDLLIDLDAEAAPDPPRPRRRWAR
jgi:3-phenylpropionate/trans-cinnamate dioxygenase ferredoxin subunit